jgi:hypothetical protein
LMRDEKGFMGIPFKRLLLAGVCGGLTYTIARIATPDVSIPIGVVLGVVVLVMTGTRGSLLLAAARDSKGFFGQIGRSLELPVELVRLDAAVVFAPAQANYDVDMREWITFARASEVDHDAGLVFVDAPMAEGAQR